ncbi:YggS family pyridoxal phosphate-dependent enzyme [Chitinophaga qingshengii]|uniref:Pyridoxal phosphate homeostasis protein n=1 Tax=Chitinophaga qingshengii TaxID=1569794 RepID=A0ABR7TN98_9BACT|nr:YggS family pyridoxal phosphate-dependent enzyme [Chitinophaga qingshengii]MBC9931956.1 YggS family pyridoxal phosphate-dependent enzyme [Chitinophaga qingshengii]
MAININAYQAVLSQLKPFSAQLVAVSKTKPLEDIEAFYAAGQRIFGENYVQELVEKQAALPADIQWHFIGHLQSNKVKYLAPFVHTIHAVDSLKLLQEINKQAAKHQRVINCLLQVHIAAEETKFGMDEQELQQLLSWWNNHQSELTHVRIAGLMGMATNTDNETQVRQEFHQLHQLFGSVKTTFFNTQDYFRELSIGMSADYTIALEEGSTMVRIGSLLFGERNYNQ